MKIFITGATGYIGGSIAKTLVDEGHEVDGLVRNPDKVDNLRKIGINPVLGNLEDKTVLRQHAECNDAVINAASSDHRSSLGVFVDALSGTGKTLIHTSGSSIIGDDALGEYQSEIIYSDDTPFNPIKIRKDRADINNFVRIAGIKYGIRAMVITPPMIYGKSLGLTAESDQLPKLISKSKEKKAGVYIGKGLNRWSNVHIQDLVNLYSLALEKGPSGAMFFAENGEESLLDIAKMISNALGFQGKVQSWHINEAIKELGDWARFAIGSNSRIKATNARNLLGWKPRAKSIQAWIEKNVDL